MPRRAQPSANESATPPALSRREREIMNALYRLGEASVAEVVAQLGDDAGYDTVRVILGILEKKGFTRHRTEGQRYIYAPAVPKDRAGQLAARELLRTCFGGAPSRAVLTLLDVSDASLSAEDLDEISEWIADAKRKKRK